MDDTEFACLKAIVFFDPNARGLTDPGVNVIRRFSLVADTEAIGTLEGVFRLALEWFVRQWPYFTTPYFLCNL
jgi:hypothetical protein